jgi:hypothetical protein
MWRMTCCNIRTIFGFFPLRHARTCDETQANLLQLINLDNYYIFFESSYEPADWYFRLQISQMKSRFSLWWFIKWFLSAPFQMKRLSHLKNSNFKYNFLI